MIYMAQNDSKEVARVCTGCGYRTPGNTSFCEKVRGHYAQLFFTGSGDTGGCIMRERDGIFLEGDFQTCITKNVSETVVAILYGFRVYKSFNGIFRVNGNLGIKFKADKVPREGGVDYACIEFGDRFVTMEFDPGLIAKVHCLVLEETIRKIRFLK